MRIVTNGFPLTSPSGGISVYTRELLRGFIQHDPDNEHFVYGVKPSIVSAAELRDLFDGSGFHDVATGKWNSPAIRSLLRKIRGTWAGRQLSRMLDLRRRAMVARFGTDIYFGTNFFGSFHHSFKTVITIHDLTYVRFPEAVNPIMMRDLPQMLPEHAQRAHAIFADSESAKRDIVEVLGVPSGKVHVVFPGVSEVFRPVIDRSVLSGVRAKYRLPEKFILFVGTIEPRKNVPLLISAFDRLCADSGFNHGLVLAGGKGWRDGESNRSIDSSPYRERIVKTGFVSVQDLPAIYSLADVFTLPSLYEGFGLPVLESMACGTPVVATNVSSLPEAVGDAGLLVEPGDPDSLAATIRELIKDEEIRQRLRLAGLIHVHRFSWDAAAKKAIAVFNSLVEG